jgi:hypothetical protein
MRFICKSDLPFFGRSEQQFEDIHLKRGRGGMFQCPISWASHGLTNFRSELPDILIANQKEFLIIKAHPAIHLYPVMELLPWLKATTAEQPCK